MWGSLHEGGLLEGRAPGRLDPTDLGLMVLVGMLGFQKSRGPAVPPVRSVVGKLTTVYREAGDSLMVLASGVCSDGRHTTEFLHRWPVRTVLSLITSGQGQVSPRLMPL